MVKFDTRCKCAMSTVTGIIAYVIKNVFSRVRKTDNDMSSRRAAGKLFHTVGQLLVAGNDKIDMKQSYATIQRT